MSETNTTITTTYEEDMEKYTKIDNLDEDNGDINYVLVSFVSPEKVMNCNMRGLKLRHYRNRPAIFSDYAAAQKAASELNEKEKYFDIFVMPTGRWCAWDPSPDDRTKVETEKWANPDQQQLMENLENMNKKQEQDLQQLNALVGKKKDMIEQGNKEYKTRVSESIKEGVKNKTPSGTTEITPNSKTTDTPQETLEEAVKQVPRNNHRNTNNIKEKLRKRLEEKKNQSQTQSQISQQSNLNELKEKMSNTLTTNNELEQNINKAKALLNKIKTEATQTVNS